MTNILYGEIDDNYSKEMVHKLADNLSKGILEEKYRYENFTKKFISVIKEASVYVDCGAEFGYYAQLALLNMKKDSRIILFEPEPSRYKALKEYYGKYNNTEIYQYAIMDKKAENVELFKVSTYNSASVDPNITKTLTQFNEKKSFFCKGISLDEFLGDTVVDVLKMDIEGAEVFSFKGMEDLLEKRKTKIFLEFHPQFIKSMAPSELNFIPDLLKKYDYKIYLCNEDECKEVEKLPARGYLVPSEMKP